MITNRNVVITIVIPLMKYFSLAWLLTMTALIALSVATIVAIAENRKLKREVSDQNETIESYAYMVGHRDNDLANARLGSALLNHLALRSEQHTDLFQYLKNISPEALSCTVKELPEYPTVRLFWFFQDRLRSDGSVRPMTESKSALLLVKSDSFDVVEILTHDGFGGLSKVLDDAWVVDWEQSDGTTIEHQIFETGFERLQ